MCKWKSILQIEADQTKKRSENLNPAIVADTGAERHT